MIQVSHYLTTNTYKQKPGYQQERSTLQRHPTRKERRFLRLVGSSHDHRRGLRRDRGRFQTRLHVRAQPEIVLLAERTAGAALGEPGVHTQHMEDMSADQRPDAILLVKVLDAHGALVAGVVNHRRRAGAGPGGLGRGVGLGGIIVSAVLLIVALAWRRGPRCLGGLGCGGLGRGRLPEPILEGGKIPIHILHCDDGSDAGLETEAFRVRGVSLSGTVMRAPSYRDRRAIDNPTGVSCEAFRR